MFVLYLCAPNDRNGNPSRGWFLFGANSNLVKVWEYEYKGIQQIPAEYRSLANVAPQINVSATEYRAWVREAER